MGGASYQIWGHLDERRLRPTPRPRTVLDRILGRRPIDAPTRLDSVGASLIDVPSRDFAPVKAHYLAFLRDRFREPWPATAWVMDYLSSSMRICVRGEQERESPEPGWYVQLSFSGSAGMSEISASVAWHWARAWHRERHHELTTLLTPLGFQPNALLTDEDDDTFVPTLDTGYALVHPDGTDAPSFEVDHAFVGGDDAAAESLIEALCEKYRDALRDGRCRCQMCDASGGLMRL